MPTQGIPGLEMYQSATVFGAKPMTLGEYRKVRWRPDPDGRNDEEGYFCAFAGDPMWIAKATFEEGYIPVEPEQT